MRKISEENTKPTSSITDEQANQIYYADKQSFDNFTSGKKKTMDFASIKRLILSELALNKSFYQHRIFGFSRKQIMAMCQYPQHYGSSILKLMDYMYQKSGFMRRLIDYFSNMPKLNYYVDTEATDYSFFKLRKMY